MRRCCLAIVALLSWGNLAFGQTPAERVLDRALQAHGGAANLSRLKARQSKTRGQVFRETPVQFTQEVSAQAPAQIRETMHLQAAKTPPAVVLTVLNGNSGRMEINGTPQTLDDNMLTELKEAAHLAQVVRLAELKSKEYQLSFVGESVVSGRPALGIKVACNGHRDVQLYFDREYGLLVKAERNVVDPRSKQTQREEALYSDWKVADGLVTPTRVTVLRDGYKFSEVEVLEVHFLEKLDDKIFAQP